LGLTEYERYTATCSAPSEHYCKHKVDLQGQEYLHAIRQPRHSFSSELRVLTVDWKNQVLGKKYNTTKIKGLSD